MTRRTPVHFPRMKVRGWRNRAKTAARHVTVFEFPFARPVRTATGYRFNVLAGPEPGAVLIRSTYVRDGWGRIIRAGA